MVSSSILPKLYIHVGQATHFLEWERDEFSKHFTIVDKPSDTAILLAFGPDVLEQSTSLPALTRCIVLFPGFGHNPLHNLELRKIHRSIIKKHYDLVFINPGPLEIAYNGLENIALYPFSVNEKMFKKIKTRSKVKKIIHVSNDSPQKDWQRSERIMKKLGLDYEVFPPRRQRFYDNIQRSNTIKNRIRRLIGINEKKYMPYGYVEHSMIVKKYYKADAFVHIAGEIKDNLYLDGKYTASLIEAGMSGCILFWHDTYNLGNTLKTVFSVSRDEEVAVREIRDIIGSINIGKHSNETRQELIKTHNVKDSVRIRAVAIKGLL